MKPIIDDKLVNHLALLGRLELTKEEKVLLQENLSEILEYVDKLKSLKTDKIQPLLHTFESHNVFRPDEIKPSLPRDESLKNAPDKEAGFFRVPRVIE